MNKSQYAVAIGARPFADLRRGFIWASSGLLPVSKRASRLASLRPLSRVFRIRLINERTTKTPIFRPLRVRPSTALLKVFS